MRLFKNFGPFALPDSMLRDYFAGYPLMSKALNATGRPIAYSCSWPAYQGGLPPKVRFFFSTQSQIRCKSNCLELLNLSFQVNYTQLGEICNLWRNYGDIQDSWDSVLNIIDWFFDNQDIIGPAAGPGRWNDPDMVSFRNRLLILKSSLWSCLAAIVLCHFFPL